MIEFQLVDHPAHWPSMCSCGSQKGPLVDTHFERNGERIYICELCGKRAALAFGFIQGKEADKREVALQQLDAKNKEINSLHELADSYSQEIGTKNARIQDLLKQLEDVKGREEQLKHTLEGVREAAVN